MSETMKRARAKCHWCGKPIKAREFINALTLLLGYRYCSRRCGEAHVNSK